MFEDTGGRSSMPKTAPVLVAGAGGKRPESASVRALQNIPVNRQPTTQPSSPPPCTPSAAATAAAAVAAATHHHAAAATAAATPSPRKPAAAAQPHPHSAISPASQAQHRRRQQQQHLVPSISPASTCSLSVSPSHTAPRPAAQPIYTVGDVCRRGVAPTPPHPHTPAAATATANDDCDAGFVAREREAAAAAATAAARAPCGECGAPSAADAADMQRCAVEAIEELRLANEELHGTLEDATRAVELLRSQNEQERACIVRLRAEAGEVAAELTREQEGKAQLRAVVDALRQELELERGLRAAAQDEARAAERDVSDARARLVRLTAAPRFSADEEHMLAAAERQLLSYEHILGEQDEGGDAAVVADGSGGGSGGGGACEASDAAIIEAACAAAEAAAAEAADDASFCRAGGFSAVMEERRFEEAASASFEMRD